MKTMRVMETTNMPEEVYDFFFGHDGHFYRSSQNQYEVGSFTIDTMEPDAVAADAWLLMNGAKKGETIILSDVG